MSEEQRGKAGRPALPTPVTTDQEYLAAILSRLDELVVTLQAVQPGPIVAAPPTLSAQGAQPPEEGKPRRRRA